MRTGAYIGQDRKAIRATLGTLQHFRDFLRSDCRRMIDPYSGWQRNEMDKAQAQQKLTWLVNVAINRKAGIADRVTDWELVRFARDVNTPRLRVYARHCPKRYRARLAHRLTTEEE
jgi:hypothetical protein